MCNVWEQLLQIYWYIACDKKILEFFDVLQSVANMAQIKEHYSQAYSLATKN